MKGLSATDSANCESQARIEGDRAGAGAGLHHPYEAIEDRCADPGECAQDLDFNGLQLSLAGPVSAGLGEPALLKGQSAKGTFFRS